MPDSDPSAANHLDRLKDRVFRHPVAAWPVLIFTALTAVISIVPLSDSQMGQNRQ